ncbi:metallophosphoesterase [Geobacter sp. DSM 9736]|uniref:WD40 domain-containing protein n=1 Tax=Geobacter sp. DSM 9736 TaxID=1277350 RepID=UPI000B613860|nr:metallophosphoesterase [Geobacter sp. DSM 9736]SNB47830.1 WD40 repeat [Geobacter sp. DSM 9736]
MTTKNKIKGPLESEDIQFNLHGVKYVQPLQGHIGRIWRIAWSPNGRILATPSSDRTIRLWNTDTGEVLHTLERHGKTVTCVAFDPEGQLLASGSQDYTVKLWEVSSGRLLRTLRRHKESIFDVVFGPKGQLASCSMDGSIILWDIVSGHANKEMDVSDGGLIAIAFDPNSGLLACGGNGGSVRIWNDQDNTLRSFEVIPSGFVTGIAFSPDGSKIACVGSEGNIRLLEVATGQPLLTIEGHTSGITSIKFYADGQLLAAKGWDGVVTVSHCDTGALLAKIPAPTVGTSNLSGIAFHPHIPLLATVASAPDTSAKYADRVVNIWELDVGLLLGQTIIHKITYTSAKVVLVGESNVGKSYLAHRIANGTPPEAGEIKSTHGMKFWPLDPERLCPTAKAPLGQRRDVVIWDMGGQEEYRLIHQLFLHDTTVALVLFNPIRGVTSFKDVETWTKYLDKQLSGRAAIKLLVGAQIDEPCSVIDSNAVQRLCSEHGFAGYFETSAISGRGIPELCVATARAINWEKLGLTSRPALFQLIRDFIETKRKQGDVILYVADLLRLLGDQFSSEDEKKAVNAVTDQLATQGVIARSRVSTGEPVLVLQVQEIERYAGSLILAARNNPRGVPALELRVIAQANFSLPGIAEDDRLPRNQEKPVMECTVQLMLEHGICFEHEGLLIFPTLFAPTSFTTGQELLHAVSLYYDFAGAIDNIYASLVAWLVLAQDFGRVRLWPDRAEFEVKDGGLCGLRKVGRPGGFAHVDVYFETNTPEHLRKEFIDFVEDHLARHGVEIQEHLAITCPCGHRFEEETLRQRIVRGDKDVGCPVCELRHNLTEGAAKARERDPKIKQQTWALRTKIEKLREKSTEQAVQVLETATKTEHSSGPIRLLHLSDLHFDATTPVKARLQWLLDDLKQDGGIDFEELDYLVITGDFTDKACAEGFEKAYDFASQLAQEFSLSAERCVFVPGNHDVTDLVDAYSRRKDSAGLNDGEWMQEGRIVLARDPQKYPLRFKPFSDGFFHKFLQRPYPTDFSEQGMCIPFWESGIQFLALNSCWQIDEFHRKRSGINVEAIARAVNMAQKQENEARESGQLVPDKPLLRIALFHHAVAGAEQMKDLDFLGNLQKNGIKLILHGDVHKMHRDQIGYWHEKRMHVVGSGSFGARAVDRPEASPRLYNAIEISRDLSSARVHTRQQTKPDGPWDGWYEWPDPDGGKGRLPYYDIKF